ncbi:MAG: phosphonate ABC transporter, permease protein PhnE [Puia sp.]|nr:phosphonate ABC transporter, permease protein PhnE [Puia sp.]
MNRPALYTLPSVRFKRKATLFSLVSILLVGTCIYLQFNPWMLVTEFHYVTELIGSMLPPNFEVLWSGKGIAFSILETISMAFLGTLFGGSIAVVLAFLAASNTMPLRFVRVLVRLVLSLQRVIPGLVIILIFVIAVGLGAFAGMLTLVFGTIGTFGQLFTEIIENTENAPSEAIYSVGASRMQVIRYAILPQVFPSFIANFLYSFDINMRAAIGLGIFGGGGIGFELFLSMRVLHYRDALALIFFTILLIIFVEKISDALRRRILGDGRLK